MKRILILISLMTILSPVSASFAKQTPQVSFTQEDKERLIRLEEGFKTVNQRIDIFEKNISQRIDDLRGLIYVVIGIMLGQAVAFFGLVLKVWDRKSALVREEVARVLKEANLLKVSHKAHK